MTGYSLVSDRPTIVIYPAVGGTPDLTQPVADAVVTVSGVDLAYNSDHGQYTGTLPAAPAVGDTVVVEVNVDGHIIEANGVVPEPPVITAPAQATHFVLGDPIELTWTTSTDPERYHFHFLDANSRSQWPRLDDGAARSFTVPDTVVDALPADGTPIRYEILAINDGEFTGPSHSTSSLGLEARTPMNRFLTLGVPPVENYFVQGLIMGDYHQNLLVHVARNDVVDRSEPAPDIIGNVNGQPLTLHEPTGRYSTTLPAAISVGDTLVLHLEGPLGDVDATGTFPAKPTVTYPADGGTMAGNLPVEVRWTSPSDPSYFDIAIRGGTYTRWSGRIPGTERSYTFPSESIDMGVDLTIALSAVNDGVFTGDHASGSSMGITNRATEVTFLRQIYVPPFP